MKIETFIKKQRSRKLIEEMIEPDFVPEGVLAQLVRAPYVREGLSLEGKVKTKAVMIYIIAAFLFGVCQQ